MSLKKRIYNYINKCSLPTRFVLVYINKITYLYKKKKKNILVQYDIYTLDIIYMSVGR